MLQLNRRPRKRSVAPRDLRHRILISAIRVISRKGYSHTTMSDVAKRANVGIGTIYSHFENKDDLLLQCMKHTIESEIESIRLKGERLANPFDKLGYFLHQHRLLLENQPYIARLLIIELRQSEGFYKRNPSYNPMQYYLDYFRDIFAEGVKRGTIRPIDPEAMALSILGTIDILLTQWLIHGRDYDIEGVWDKYRDIIRDGLAIR